VTLGIATKLLPNRCSLHFKPLTPILPKLGRSRKIKISLTIGADHLNREVKLEKTMYVLSIDDRGEERNFLATNLHFVGDQLRVTINGDGKSFDLSQLMNIMAVDEASSSSFLSVMPNPQVRLS
jgi:hypothetical protein